MKLTLFAALAVALVVTAGADRFVSPEPAHAATRIYVNQDATGANDGTSWADAFTDLQDGLAAAGSGDEVWVAGGTYKPTAIGDRTATFFVKAGVKVYGSFGGFEGGLAQRFNLASPTTILSGEVGSALSRVDNSYHVVTMEPNDGSSLLDGFRVARGHANGPVLATQIGAGIQANSRAKIRNSVIEDNRSQSNGAGVYGSRLDIADSTIANNVAISGNGGGIIETGAGSLNRVTFRGNRALGGGAAWFTSAQSSFVNNATFTGNEAVSGASILVSSQASVNVSNSTFSDEQATGVGSGIVQTQTQQAELTARNIIVWGNSGATATPTAGSSIKIEFSILEGACPAAVTCGSVGHDDPELGALGNHGGLVDTFPIATSSPALDAASNLFCTDEDARNGIRPFDGDGDGDPMCDVGAYEYIAPPTLEIQDTEGDFSEADGQIFFTVHFSHKNPEGVKFEVVAAAGTATPGKDFTYSGPRVVDVSTDYGFIAHQLTLKDDQSDEPAETAVFKLQNPERAILGDSTTFTATISDDDDPPFVAFDLPKSNGLEKLEKPKITVRLSAVSSLDVKVGIIAGGTATLGEDFTKDPLPLTIPAGKLSANLDLTVLDDGTPEGSETIVLDLINPSNAVKGSPSRHVYRINNDDKATRCFGLKTTLYGTLGNDVIKGTGAADVIDGRGGADDIASLGGNDVVCGRGGKDLIRGGPGNDRLDGGAGPDTLKGAGGNDRLLGTSGNDSLFGQAGRDRLFGGQGAADRCDGGAGTDTLAAAHGCETVAGVP